MDLRQGVGQAHGEGSRSFYIDSLTVELSTSRSGVVRDEP
jgi:hypothetical protein